MRALLVDDERLARRELRALLAAHPIEVVGEADAVAPALAALAALAPDVMFLDIQLRGETGFDLLARAHRPCRVIFVTAHDQHALRAFDVNALDYLVKPVHPARLALALARLAAPSPVATTRLAPDDQVFIEERGRGQFIAVAAIRAIRAAGDYSELVGDGVALLSPRPLRDWEARLPERQFARVHRQAIVNLAHVDRVAAGAIWLHGLAEPIPLSRRHAARVKARFK